MTLSDPRSGASVPPPIVIAYHSVHEAEAGIGAEDVIVSPGCLERQVRALQGRGYRFITATELATETGGAPPPMGTAVLTFDDGWLDGLTVAAPLLARLGIKGSFFVCPGLWDGYDARMGAAGHVLSKRQAHELHAAGMDLGAHSLTHPDLRALDDEALNVELIGAKTAVEAITGAPCRTLAYPFGLHDARVRREASRVGFELAFTFSPGPWIPMAAPRIAAQLIDVPAPAYPTPASRPRGRV